MLTKLPCGCKHNDTHWTERCPTHNAEDITVSARWAAERAVPIPVRVYRINGVVQPLPYTQADIDAYVESKQEAPTCPEPMPTPTNGSNSSSPTSEQPLPIDYSALLKF